MRLVSILVRPGNATTLECYELHEVVCTLSGCHLDVAVPLRSLVLMRASAIARVLSGWGQHYVMCVPLDTFVEIHPVARSLHHHLTAPVLSRKITFQRRLSHRYSNLAGCLSLSIFLYDHGLALP